MKEKSENDENQNLHETNMILTENLLNSVELQDKLLLQLHYEMGKKEQVFVFVCSR